jgi:hypothetical protein
VKALAEAGLEALAAIESGAGLPADRLAVCRAQIAPHIEAAAANTSVVAALMSPQPPHGLVIAIVPGIAELVEAAGEPRSDH